MNAFGRRARYWLPIILVLILSRSLQLTSGTNFEFTVLYHGLCHDVNVNNPPGQKCVGPTNSFVSSDNKIASLVEFNGVKLVHKLYWEWFEPDGAIYANSSAYTIGDNGPGYYWGWWEIDLNGTAAASKLGNWTVKIYVDGTSLVSDSFSIVGYQIFPTPRATTWEQAADSEVLLTDQQGKLPKGYARAGFDNQYLYLFADSVPITYSLVGDKILDCNLLFDTNGDGFKFGSADDYLLYFDYSITSTGLGSIASIGKLSSCDPITGCSASIPYLDEIKVSAEYGPSDKSSQPHLKLKIEWPMKSLQANMSTPSTTIGVNFLIWYRFPSEYPLDLLSFPPVGSGKFADVIFPYPIPEMPKGVTPLQLVVGMVAALCVVTSLKTRWKRERKSLSHPI